MTPFLKLVAQAYIKHHSADLHHFCFVFPNKRSGLFFEDYLRAELHGRVAMMPEITNITDFTASLTEYTEASRFDMIFTLFNEYRKINGADIEFDKFVFWADMLISDFNDIDRHLVNPDEIFVNIRRLREISANYLTDEQRDLIKHYWGEDCFENVGFSDDERFWNHIDYDGKGNNRAKEKFFKLWEILSPLYHAYTDSLAAKGLASSGRISRLAAESLNPKHGGNFEADYERYIFVGFNVLSPAEIEIFSRLHRRELADFYWDCNSPLLRNFHNRAARFVLRNKKVFPSLYDIGEEEIQSIPEIEILGVPSQIGQVKMVGERLKQMGADGAIKSVSNAIDTAVVLPNEGLLIPLLHSLPEEFTAINITMGFPMRYNPMASLFRSIVTLRLHGRQRDDDTYYYYEDVEALLSAPPVRMISPDEADNVITKIRSSRLFNVPYSVIAETAPSYEAFFRPITDINQNEAIRDMLLDICDVLSKTHSVNDSSLQIKFISAYAEAVNNLFDAAHNYHIDIPAPAFFKLVERGLMTSTVQFSGEPLLGLQVMGVLETRALDFENVVMMSLNEHVFPRKHYTRSFISDALRRDFGMATLDFQESIYAYYFYRLLSRAKRATLVYDSRNVGGLRNNEMSRYLSQLLYLAGRDKIKYTAATFSPQAFEVEPICIHKTPEIMAKLAEFCSDGSGRFLSASSIKTYINCPFEFYLSKVERYSEEEELTDFMDYSTYGNIIHDVMQQIYDGFAPQPGTPYTVTKEMLEPLLEKQNTTIDRLIVKNINLKYHRLNEDKLMSPLKGESLILSALMKDSVEAMLAYDIQLCPFEYIGSEVTFEGKLKISDNLSVNFQQRVDRIDRIRCESDAYPGSIMRFIDYKTGKDALKAQSLEAVFSGDHKVKAFLQLILYCHFYNQLHGTDEPVQPMIYSVNNIALNKKAEPLRIANEVLTDYHDVIDQFLPLLRQTVEEIFDADTPFRQAESSEACTFCQFKDICERKAVKY